MTVLWEKYRRLLKSGLFPKLINPSSRMQLPWQKPAATSLPDIIQVYHNSIVHVNQKLNGVLYSRLHKKLEKLSNEGKFKSFDFNTFLDHFEIPSEIRTLINPEKKNIEKNISNLDIPEFLDGLSFPFLASSLILAANFTARVFFIIHVRYCRFSLKLPENTSIPNVCSG